MKSYLIRVVDKFDAAHKLEGYDGPCSNLHGHTWKVVVEVRKRGMLNPLGMVMDFKQLKGYLKEVLSEFDHKVIDFLEPNPTAEIIAWYISNRLSELIGTEYELTMVEVWESDNACAIYKADSA